MSGLRDSGTEDGTGYEKREDGLPRWVQDKLRALRRALEEHRKLVDALEGTASESAIYLPRSPHIRPTPTYLPGRRVEAEHAGVHVSVILLRHPRGNQEGVRIEFEAIDPFKHDGVAVAPHASNSIALIPLPREIP